MTFSEWLMQTGCEELLKNARPGEMFLVVCWPHWYLLLLVAVLFVVTVIGILLGLLNEREAKK